MSTIARAVVPTSFPAATLKRSYAHAHWYFLVSFLVIVAGFWPTFYRPMGSGTAMKNLHGVTSSLWYFGLMAQSWLISRGPIAWHRRTAMGMIVLLPILAVSALSNTSRMLTTSVIPPAARPIIAFADFQLVGFGPALARLYDRLHLAIGSPINAPTITQNLILLTMIVVDWRNGERKPLAYPLMIIWNIGLQFLAVPRQRPMGGWHSVAGSRQHGDGYGDSGGRGSNFMLSRRLSKNRISEPWRKRPSAAQNRERT